MALTSPAALTGRFVLAIVAVVLMVLWTVVIRPLAIPALDAVVGADGMAAADEVGLAWPVTTARFVAATGLAAAVPVAAYVCGVLWLRTRQSDRAQNALITGLLLGGLLTGATYGVGVVALLDERSLVEAYRRPAREHLAHPGDEVVGAVLLGGAVTAAVLVVILVVALYSAPPRDRLPSARGRRLWLAWVVLPVTVALGAGILTGLSTLGAT